MDRCDGLSYLVAALDVMLAMREGRLTEAEELADRCYALGVDVGDANALGWYGAQLVAIRWLQGRGEEVLPLLGDLVTSPTVAEPCSGSSPPSPLAPPVTIRPPGPRSPRCAPKRARRGTAVEHLVGDDARRVRRRLPPRGCGGRGGRVRAPGAVRRSARHGEPRRGVLRLGAPAARARRVDLRRCRSGDQAPGDGGRRGPRRRQPAVPRDRPRHVGRRARPPSPSRRRRTGRRAQARRHRRCPPLRHDGTSRPVGAHQRARRWWRRRVQSRRPDLARPPRRPGRRRSSHRGHGLPGRADRTRRCRDRGRRAVVRTRRVGGPRRISWCWTTGPRRLSPADRGAAREIDDADENVDLDRAAQPAELDQLVAELARATGFGGRGRCFADEAERARRGAKRSSGAGVDHRGRAGPRRRDRLRVVTGTRCVFRGAHLGADPLDEGERLRPARR